jgi:EAL domain-containing protein (putative c-di-GMP-specific phosphodiesterase class I)
LKREKLDLLLNGEQLSTVFQPIFDISSPDCVVWGLEALTRGPAGTHFEQASVLFDYIRLKQEEVAADRCCIGAAFAARVRLLPKTIPRLTLNVHAGTLERDRTFPSYVEAIASEYGIDTRDLVVEIIEQSTYFDSTHLTRALNDLRSLGVRISIDDLGLGHGNYRLILDADPDFLKLDRYFIHGCAEDHRRRALIASVQQLGVSLGCAVIAEGVERMEDLLTLRAMNIALIQGFLLAPPGAPPALEAPEWVRSVLRREERVAAERS